MSKFLGLTSRQSVLRAPRMAVVVAANAQERLATAGMLAVAASWLTYTRFYFWLQPRHLTYDGPFMYLTGKPDPACGLTRTYAWMWRGDVLHAFLVYPLGPLMFTGTLAFVAYSLGTIVSGRSLRLALSPRAQRNILIGALVAIGLNWASKLIWLGM